MNDAANIPVCHLCQDVRSTHYMHKNNFDYYRCRNCDGVFVWPLKSQTFYLGTDTYLSDPNQYAGMIDPYGQRWMIEQFERLYAETMDTPHKGSFFEVGAGAGYLALFALARGWDVQGIETSAPAVKFAQDYLRVPVEHSIIETYKTDKKFDAVAMVEVLEHFLDPVQAIESLRPFAKERTFLFGTTPNTDSDHWLTGDQDIYVPEDHIFLFNRYSIQKFAEKAGVKNFTVEVFGSGEKHDSNLMYAGVLEAA
jgi:SAM-dependent methyltransferase